MCKEVEKVLNENKEESTSKEISCTVTMEDVNFTSEDFIAVLSKEDGGAAIFYNTDALTMGLAMKMVAKAFVDAMAQLTEEERASVQAVLGGDFEVEHGGAINE